MRKLVAGLILWLSLLACAKQAPFTSGIICGCDLNAEPDDPFVAWRTMDAAAVEKLKAPTLKQDVENYLKRKPLDSLTWPSLLMAALAVGDKDLFRKTAQTRVDGIQLKQLQADLLVAAAKYQNADMLNWLYTDAEWAPLEFDLAGLPYLTPSRVDCKSFPCNKVHETILMQAARAAKTSNLIWLMAHGANFQAVDDKQKNALNWAIEGKQWDNAAQLLAQGLSVNPDKPESPLFTAIRTSDHDGIDWLIARGASLEARGATKLTQNEWASPLEFAAALGAVPMIEKLLALGANPAQPENAQTLLIFLNSKMNRLGPAEVEMLRKMLGYKPDLKVRDALGRTALMTLVASERQPSAQMLESFWLLMQAGAELRAADKQGKTVLMYVAESNHLAIFQTLLDAGLAPDLNIYDIPGYTARDYAHYQDGDIARYLDKHPEL